jgi:predicted O-linked N-acetylglucosamine transferase (SPINDLY family)
VKRQSENPGAWLGKGIAQLQQGELAQAEASFRRILKQDPAHADANHLLGLVALQRGRHELAIRLILQAIRANPAAALYHSNLGFALNGAGRLREALAACERATQLSPDMAEAHYNRGNALTGLGRLQEGLAAYERTIQFRPQHIDAHYAKGAAFACAGRPREAEHSFRRVLELNPRHVRACSNLAVVLASAGNYVEALAASERAIELAPNYANAHNCRANALRKLFRLEEALQAVDRAIALKPDDADAHYNRANMLLQAGMVEEADASFRRALELRPGDASLHSNLLFIQAARASQPCDQMLGALRQWDEVHGREGRRAVLPERRESVEGGRRLRVGYVSPHFHSHVVSFFFEPLLAAHDRSRFEIVCYASFLESRADAVTRRLRESAEHWHFVGDKDDAELARLVREDGIDILVDLTGHTADNRLKAFTYRPAPVQASYLGFFASTGLAAMDYWITDEVIHPQDTPERASEKVYRLPRCWVSYRPSEEAPAVSPCPNADENVVFGSFSNLTKLTPAVIETWSRLLQALPGSRLLLMARLLRDPMVRSRLVAGFAHHGIGEERLILRNGAPYAEYFATYAEVDIVLDPFPRTGGTTTAEALWMGVPVVTLAGQRYVERISASKLKAIGLQDLIAGSPEEYIRKACLLARDPGKRGELRAGLREKMAQSALCDGEGLARSMEAAYLAMWQEKGLG